MKCSTYMTHHELQIAHPLHPPGGHRAAAHGAFQSSTPPFTTCGDAPAFYSRPPDEAINADYQHETLNGNIWALESRA